MSSAIRSQASTRLAQSFSATSPRLPAAIGARKLHITGAKEQSPAINSFESVMAGLPKRNEITPGNRSFNTSRSLKTVNDSSTVDFAYMPAVSFANPASTEIQPIPLLPDSYAVRRSSVIAEPPVSRAEISTTSLGSTVTAMSEAETSKAADVIGMIAATKEVGIVKQLWNDVLDDVFGPKAPSTA